MGNSILNKHNATQNRGNGVNTNMLQQFRQFKSAFTGDPQQTVMSLVQQGKISSQQLQQLSQMAQQLQDVLR